MTSIIAMQYITVQIFCILVLILLLRSFIANSGMQTTSRLYIRMIICNVVNFLLDSAYFACDSKLIRVHNGVLYVIMLLYFITSAATGVFWILYAAEEQGISVFHKKRNRFLCYIPFTVYMFMADFTHWTRWIFYIDENGHYQRGSLFILQYIVPYGYIIAASIMSLKRAYDKDNFLNRKKSLLLAAFIIPPAIGAAVQLYVQDLPLLCMGITFMLLVLFVNQQNSSISIDTLTQVNNRFQIIRHLSNKVAAYDDKKPLYLFMIDLNLFKKINDTYGHVEGDAALVRTAVTLKKVCMGKDYFIGRYGGDEFILICEIPDKAGADALCSEINAEIEKANDEAETEYKISLSIGYTQYARSYKDIVSFIAAADAELYKVKKARKIQRD